MPELKSGGTTTQIKSRILVTYEVRYFSEGTSTPWNAWIRFGGKGPFHLKGGQVSNVNIENRAQAVHMAFNAELETMDLENLAS